MILSVTPDKKLNGSCCVPGDKSISHRAALIGSMAEGKTVIHNFSKGADCYRTLQCLKALGVEIQQEDGKICIFGRGLNGFCEPDDLLDAGNSGTTMRLLLGLLAGQDFFSVITGDPSLRRRPMGRVIDPLVKMGAEISARCDNTLPPICIRGTNTVHPIEYILPIPSAQVKSAILLAGMNAKGQTTVIQRLPSRDHTERMLQYFGAALTIKDNVICLQGKRPIKGQQLQIPGDISSAAFIMAAAVLVPGSEVLIRDVGINPTRTGILDVLKMMGAQIDVLEQRSWNGEPVADLLIRSSKLKGTEIKNPLLPRVLDEIPVLAVAAAAAEGETVISDAAELRVKETDRLKAVASELCKMNVEIKEKADGLIIRGGKLRAARVNSWGDHRMAMALAVAGLIADGETIVEDAGCIDISFPAFLDVMKALGAAIRAEN
ncbi:MAG: 3-phosphoshikimate 1-carboxyvinyltransferase [Thermacetogeniaceae bacterium]|nr:3-phosphoshikimate 1-carboxyvinyltransferase [Syntrophomonadaceae bacterium]